MNAVATPTRAKNSGARVKKAQAHNAPPARTATHNFPAETIKAAFGQVEMLLSEAYMTDEDHGWSGDSDRLLCVAKNLADRAEIDPPQGPQIYEEAFNIAALIRAARLVPGDSESPQRKALIDQAAVHLNWLTECDMGCEDCCNPGVSRPTAPGAAPRNLTTDASEEAECLELARQANYEIQRLAETMQVLAEHFGNEDHPIANGIAARIIVLSEIVFNAAALHGQGRAESLPADKLQRAFRGGL